MFVCLFACKHDVCMYACMCVCMHTCMFLCMPACMNFMYLYLPSRALLPTLRPLRKVRSMTPLPFYHDWLGSWLCHSNFRTKRDQLKRYLRPTCRRWPVPKHRWHRPWYVCAKLSRHSTVSIDTYTRSESVSQWRDHTCSSKIQTIVSISTAGQLEKLCYKRRTLFKK